MARFGGFFSRQVIRIAAGMGNNLCLAFKSQNAGDGAIQKIAVMADDQNRAVIIGNHFLKQFQRFNIQIIGRLIKNQKIMGLGK